MSFTKHKKNSVEFFEIIFLYENIKYKLGYQYLAQNSVYARYEKIEKKELITNNFIYFLKNYFFDSIGNNKYAKVIKFKSKQIQKQYDLYLIYLKKQKHFLINDVRPLRNKISHFNFWVEVEKRELNIKIKKLKKIFKIVNKMILLIKKKRLLKIIKKG